MSVLYTLTALIGLVLVYLWKRIKNKDAENAKTLPGPSILEALQIFVKGGMTNKLHVDLSSMADKYGDVMYVNLLVRRMVFTNDVKVFRKLVKAAEFRDVTNHRPPTFFAKYHFKGTKGITFGQIGSEHVQKRKTFHTFLKFYGEGKGQFEQVMIGILQNYTESLTPGIIDLTAGIRLLVASFIHYLLSGQALGATTEQLETIARVSACVDKVFLLEHEIILQPFPFLRLIPGLPFKKVSYDLSRASRDLHSLYFYPAKDTYNPSQKRGLVDELLAIQQIWKEEKTGLEVDDDTVQAIIQDVAVAAFITTSSTLESLFLHIIKYPKVQARIYEEIHRVVGTSVPSFQHKSEMSYTEAVILETLRISSNVPFLLPHLITKDIVYDGYFIPKNTILSMNAWHNHHRPDFWPDPYVFKPERFLDPDGQLVPVNHPARQRLVNFGTGPRACPGEIFAKTRMFLILMYILNKYELLPDDTEEGLPPVDPRKWVGVSALGPDCFKCRIKPRNDS